MNYPPFDKERAMKLTDVVKSYYAAFDTHDFARARALMRDDFRFVGPMMEANSPEELFSKMKAFDCDFENHLLQMAENGNTVAALYDCIFTRPFMATIRMSEWFTVEGGKIASANLVYDTRQMPMPSGS
jgi:ketosteroid isomerase-like protein